MQLFEDVLASGQLGLRMYSKSTAVEVHSHQWEFCHYQELEKGFSDTFLPVFPLSLFRQS